ncbi:MAG: hypothetical protein HYU64_13845 [Armatimonadetes bacterium]|nr:hypothetical protein [Armatimonadota bacterium]
MSRKLTREESLRLVDGVLASLPEPGQPEACETCRALPAQAEYYERGSGIELERRGEMPEGKASLAELLTFDEWTVLFCQTCSTLYLYSREYDSYSGHGWELSEWLERRNSAQIRSYIADLLDTRPQMVIVACQKRRDRR